MNCASVAWPEAITTLAFLALLAWVFYLASKD